MRKPLLVTSLFLAAFMALWLAFEATASPALQVEQYATPTPGPDGRIIYIVQKGDDCTRISILTGVSIDFIRQTNRLDENCSIIEGQELVIGYGGPAVASPSPGPPPTPTAILPTPTAFTGSAEVCVSLYEDVNGDGMRQADTDEFDNYIPGETEPTIEGGAASLTSLTGTYSQTMDTIAGYDPVCFADVPEGQYTISVAIPDGYNPTTVLNFTLEVKPGDRTFVGFGAQSKIQPAPLPEEGEGGRSPVLGIFGAIFLLTGLGLGFYAWRLRR